MQFKAEKISDTWDEIFPLIKMNFDETGVKGPVFNPSKKVYELLQEAKILHFIVARNKFGEPMGYSFMHISMHPHFQDVIFATQDAFYLLPQYRGIIGYKFFQFVEQDLLSNGVSYVARDSCHENDWSKTLIRSGYREVKQIFVKKLEA